MVRACNKNVGRFVDHVEGYVFFFDFKYGFQVFLINYRSCDSCV